MGLSDVLESLGGFFGSPGREEECGVGKVGGTSKEKGVLDCFQKGTTALWPGRCRLGRLISPLPPAGNRYVHNLYNYLLSFIQRTQPLLNVEEILDGNVDGGEEGATKKAEAAFEAL